MTTKEEREFRESIFSIFGVSRFAMYEVAGLSLYYNDLKLAGVAIMAGATIEIVRRLYYSLKD